MDKETLLKNYGDSPIAYLTLETDLQYFEDKKGFIAHVNKSVIGDPIINQKYINPLLKEFSIRYPKHCFYHINERTAEQLSKLGYFTSFMGYEHQIDLNQIVINWTAFPSLKSGANKCLNQGIKIIEQKIDELDHNILADIETKWLQSKKIKTSVRFMIRQLDFKKRKDFRYFFAYHEKKVIAYYFFSPLYKNNKLIGYYTDNARYLPKFKKNLSDLFLSHCITQFKSEGHQTLSLGLNPFAEAKTSPFKQHTLIPLLFKLIYQFDFPGYGYQGIHRYTQKFHGIKTPYFFASKKKFPIINLVNTWKYMCFNTKD